ncbi:MAG: hypothetical protein FJ116_12805 [Deltaproteobacteria bacterium]|nr:hypothetical protein [Deltaproteobacteria bacterium]
MKIKISISNYGSNQLWCLERMLEEFSKFKKYTLDITEYTTEKTERKHHRFGLKIGQNLPYQCRPHMAKAINDFDLFLYNENDHLITEENIDAFVEHQATLPFHFVSGFIRYEERDSEQILLDPNPFWGKLINKNYGDYFSLVNNHQGCWLLTRDHLRYCIKSGEFLHRTGRGPYGCLEQGATDPYNRCGLTKVFPSDPEKLKKHLILHLPKKYSLQPQWISHGIKTSNLRELLTYS